MAVDESQRQLWSDVATLILEGVHWRSMEVELFKRWGHTDGDKPLWTLSIHRRVLNPLFWGNSAQHIRGAGRGLWMVEAGHDIPAGVQISYGVAPAVYTGELADEIKAELRRRQEINHGAGRSKKTAWFRGLFLCQGCGYTVIGYPAPSGRYLHCMTNNMPRMRRCESRVHLSERKARKWVTNFLGDVILYGADAIAAQDVPRPDADGLRRELDALNDRARRIIRQRLDYEGTDVERFYTDELADANKRIASQKARIAEAERELARIRPPDEHSIEELRKIGVDGFWSLPEEQINRRLHLLLNGLKIVVHRHEILGLFRKSS